MTNLPKQLEEVLHLVDLLRPVPLEQADLSCNIIYWRPYGVFHMLPSGSHPAALAFFYDFIKHSTPDSEWDDWHLFDDGLDVEEKADKFLLTTPGTCYKSSMSNRFIAGRPEFITRFEMNFFEHFTYLHKENLM